MDDFQKQLGGRLRAIRRQQGLTLQQVEERSGGRWKAVVVGSYERGDRAVSADKLAQLARFYGVPIRELVPDPAGEGFPVGHSTNGHQAGLTVDLRALESAMPEEPDLAALARLVASVQARRSDYNGRVLSLRADDVRSLAIVLGRDPDRFATWLSDHGVVTGA